ncbi:MAG: hypothetical protein VX466_05240 [Myxococcota bacterium]|nr:hypothetical protein [Myxococcota bacterium]
MGEASMKIQIAEMMKRLDDDEVEMEGLDLDGLKAAISHPKALETLAKWMPFEATSVQPGEPAPDFSVPYMPGHGGESDAMTLSSHFGSRPVALIFGSYT